MSVIRKIKLIVLQIIFYSGEISERSCNSPALSLWPTGLRYNETNWQLRLLIEDNEVIQDDVNKTKHQQDIGKT